MNLGAKVLLALPLAFSTFAATALPSHAVGVKLSDYQFATSVKYREGAGVAANRKVQTNALGTPQFGNIDFLSLGLGGQAIFGFGTAFNREVRIWETTWGNHTRQSAHDERVRIFVGNTGEFDATDWVSIGELWNIQDDADSRNGAAKAIAGSNSYRFVKLVDISPRPGSSGDGFDVNAIGVRPVPEPATISGLAVAAAGLVAARRRKTQEKAVQEG